MFKRGRKRQSKGLAVLYFIVGLLILLIVLAIIYFALVKLDYSDQIIDPNTEIRSYAVPTATVAIQPSETEAPAEEDTEINEDSYDEGSFIDDEETETITDSAQADPEESNSEEAETEEADFGDFDYDDDGALPENDEFDEAASTEEPVVTDEPTEEPTIEPTATPAPTKVPASKINKATTKSLKLPAKSKHGVIGITKCDVPDANKGRVMHLSGYGYVNSAKFNGKKAKSYMVITQRSNGKKIIYELTMKKGASGESHSKAKCKNASSSDYELYIDVAKYKDDIYSMSLVIQYVPSGTKKARLALYPFENLSFTVLNGKIETPVPVDN